MCLLLGSASVKVIHRRRVIGGCPTFRSLQKYYKIYLLTLTIIIDLYNYKHNSKYVQMFKLQTKIFLLIMLSVTLCLHIDPPAYKISSTLASNHFQIIIQLSENLEHQSLELHTQGFSQQHSKHVFKLKQDKVQIQPNMKSEEIAFNYKEGNQYLVALVHQIEDKKVNFLPIDVSYRGSKAKYLLAAMDTKLGQIPLQSLYSCHKTLLSIQQSNEDDVDYHLYLFTTNREQGIWITQNEYYSWRHHYNNVYFGQIRIKKSYMPYRLLLTAGRSCTFDVESMRKKIRDAQEGSEHQRKEIQRKKYYTVEELLQEVPKLQVVVKKMEPQMEEL